VAPPRRHAEDAAAIPWRGRNSESVTFVASAAGVRQDRKYLEVHEDAGRRTRIDDR